MWKITGIIEGKRTVRQFDVKEYGRCCHLLTRVMFSIICLCSVVKLMTFSVNDYDRCCHLVTDAAFSCVQCFNVVSMLVTFNYMAMK